MNNIQKKLPPRKTKRYKGTFVDRKDALNKSKELSKDSKYVDGYVEEINGKFRVYIIVTARK